MSKDRFSESSKLYVKFRPTYPQELYDFVFQFVKDQQIAWDCGTGNGQVAQVLSSHFTEVYASDISQKQLDEAIQLSNIQYVCCDEKHAPFRDSVVDLVTVAQAIHWFDFDLFYKEVRRVTKKGSILAIWGYNLLKISPPIDALIQQFYNQKVGNFWDIERKHVEADYQTIPFPFEQIYTAQFEMACVWDLFILEGYLNTWSSVSKFIRANGYNPVNELIENLASLWQKNEQKTVVFPIFVKVAVV